MFANLGCHVLRFPSGRWGFRGSVPLALLDVVPADTAAVLGCRAWRDEAGALVCARDRVFPDEASARAAAAAAGVALSN